MVISTSRRSDIPAFFSSWFVESIQRREAWIPRAFRSGMQRISLKKEDVDAFVFWTRHPEPFHPALDVLDREGHLYVFLITALDYAKSLQPAGPGLEAQVAAIRKLSRRIGRERVAWRYDPVIFTPEMDADFHCRCFERLLSLLGPFCARVIVSFVDFYPRMKKRLQKTGVTCLGENERPDWVERFLVFAASRCRESGLKIQSCAEEVDTSAYGVEAGKCIDEEWLNRLFGLKLLYKKDPGQRRHCLCHQSMDIGTYRTCGFGCLYCYAR